MRGQDALAPKSCLGSEARLGKHAPQALALRFEPFHVERLVACSQIVAATVVVERLVHLAVVLERLAEREMQCGAVAPEQILPLLRRQHGAPFRVGEAIGLEVRKAPPRLAEAGIGTGRVAVSANTCIRVAERLVDVTEREMHARLTRVDGERPFECACCFHLLEAPRQHRAQRRPALGEFGVQLHGALCGSLGVRESRPTHGKARKCPMHMADVGGDRHRTLQQAFGVVCRARVDGDVGEAHERVDVVRVCLQHVSIAGLGFPLAAFRAGLDSRADVGKERIAGNGFALRGAGVVVSAFGKQAIRVALPRCG